MRVDSALAEGEQRGESSREGLQDLHEPQIGPVPFLSYSKFNTNDVKKYSPDSVLLGSGANNSLEKLV